MMNQPLIAAAQAARAAGRRLAFSPIEQRNEALDAIRRALLRRKDDIFSANQADMDAAQGLDAPIRKRLSFGGQKLAEVTAGIDSLISLPDPLGHTQLATELAPGLELYRVSCPIGVVGVIFESRPDALVQIATLCLKSGNAALLKGGSEAQHTNAALYEAILEGSREAGLPEGWLGMMQTRQEVSAMLQMDEWIDLIIPRGSNAFVRYIMDHSSIPVLGHADGLCHVYVDRSADIPLAIRVSVDAKAQYVSVCNACETLLVHQDIAPAFLPALKPAMEQAGVRLKGCERTRAIIGAEPASDADWDAEYLDYVLSIRVVDTLDEAIAFINRHGSGHTDAIMAQDQEAASRFLNEVDSAGCYLNCSTRFADGFRYGFGAEVGVSTGKVHARGPMGLEGLTIYKYKLLGSGQTVGDFASGKAAFTHRPLDRDCPL